MLKKFHELRPYLEPCWRKVLQIEADLFYERDFCQKTNIAYSTAGNHYDRNCIRTAIGECLRLNSEKIR